MALTTLVRYQVRPETADENESRISDVFRELQEKRPKGVRYLALRLQNDEFVHLAAPDDDALPLTELKTFQAFRAGGELRWIDPPRFAQGELIDAFGFLAPDEMTDIRTAALAYLDGWKRKDADNISGLLHPEVRLTGPMSRHQGRDAVMASFRSLFPALDDVALRHLLVDGEQAIAVYDFVCAEPFGSVRMADLIGFKNGLIHSIEMFFNPRPFEGAVRG
jgi:hypothetical protein